MRRGGAGRGTGRAALADPDQHGLQRGHHDLCRGRARRHRFDRRCARGGARAWPLHRLLRRLRGAGLYHRGRLRAAFDPARDPARGTGDQMSTIEQSRSGSMSGTRAAIFVVLAGIGFFLPKLLGGTSVAYSTLTTIAIFAVMCYGIDIVLSYLGEVSLGHTLFWSIGGYTAANLSVKYGLNGWSTAF